MRVEISPQLYPKRGGEVVVGNVYANNRRAARPRNFRIVVGIAGVVNGRVPWNKVVLIHVDGQGGVCGASQAPVEYVKNHWDLIGRVREMPTLKIEWLHEGER